jgi:hypothetical protein
MARSPRPRGPRNDDEEERERRSGRERKESGDDPRRHASIIERRWLGSPPPTSERYARALRQWHALPGAVVWPATDVTASAEPPAPAGSAADESEP